MFLPLDNLADVFLRPSCGGYMGVPGWELPSLVVFNSFRFVVITCRIYFVYLKCVYLFAYTVECNDVYIIISSFD